MTESLEPTSYLASGGGVNHPSRGQAVDLHSKVDGSGVMQVMYPQKLMFFPVEMIVLG